METGRRQNASSYATGKRVFTLDEKVDAIVHIKMTGCTKAGMARSLRVAESTFRGWFKNKEIATRAEAKCKELRSKSSAYANGGPSLVGNPVPANGGVHARNVYYGVQTHHLHQNKRKLKKPFSNNNDDDDDHSRNNPPVDQQQQQAMQLFLTQLIRYQIYYNITWSLQNRGKNAAEAQNPDVGLVARSSQPSSVSSYSDTTPSSPDPVGQSNVVTADTTTSDTCCAAEALDLSTHSRNKCVDDFTANGRPSASL